jgi:hypothetical protein
MFFIGIFGVETKSKEIKDINNITCKQCGRFGVYMLVKKYSEIFYMYGEEKHQMYVCPHS